MSVGTMSCKLVHRTYKPTYIRPRGVDIDIGLVLHWTLHFTALSKYEVEMFKLFDRSYLSLLLHTSTGSS